VLVSFRATVQSAEIISLILDSWRKLPGDNAPLPEHTELQI